MEAVVIAVGSSFVAYGAEGWKNRVRCIVLFLAGVACGYIIFSHK